MEFKELQGIINTMSESKLSSLEIQWEGVTIKMKKDDSETVHLKTIKAPEEHIKDSAESDAVE